MGLKLVGISYLCLIVDSKNADVVNSEPEGQTIAKIPIGCDMFRERQKWVMRMMVMGWRGWEGSQKEALQGGNT